MKKLIILLALLFIVPQVSATMPLNYFSSVVEDSPINVYYSIFLQNTTKTLIDLRSTSILRSSQIDWSVISADLDGYMHTPNNGDIINLTCFDQPFLQYLDSQPSWHAEGTWIQTIQLNTGSSNMPSLSPAEANFTKYSMLCYATITGDNAWITFVFKTKIESQLTKAFQVPDEATNEIIFRTQHTLTAAFDIAKLVIMMVGFLLLIFIITYLIKAFIFFIKKLRGQ
jgi:hypothetical protein